MEMTKKDRNAEICRMRESGMKLDQIGTQFGITKERVRQIVNSKEPERPTGRPFQLGLHDEKTVMTIIAYVNAGLKIGTAASELGVNESALCNRLRRIAKLYGHDPRTFFGLRAILSDYVECGIVRDCGDRYELCGAYKKGRLTPAFR